MSDSESSDLIDSEAGLEENEDELLLSSEEGEELMSASGEEDDSEMEEEESPEEVFMEDEEGEEEEEEDDDDDDSAEEDRKLTEDELHRLYLDDFSSDDEVGIANFGSSFSSIGSWKYHRQHSYQVVWQIWSYRLRSEWREDHASKIPGCHR